MKSIKHFSMFLFTCVDSKSSAKVFNSIITGMKSGSPES